MATKMVPTAHLTLHRGLRELDALNALGRIEAADEYQKRCTAAHEQGVGKHA